MRESLSALLPRSHPLAGRESLRLAELDGETFLLYAGVGFWRGVCERLIPRAHYATQDDYLVFSQLARTWLLFFAAVISASVLFAPACESMQAALASLGGAAFSTEGFQADRARLIALNVYLVVLSAAMIAISACKPWGRIKYAAKKAAAR